MGKRRIMIAGTNSGCGKTTITCAILMALVNRKMNIASFKCGPDYIDPMFHSKVIGTKSGNLDGFFFDRATLRFLLDKNSTDADMSVIEGVMGYYDGIGMEELASSYSIARDTDTPVILVVNCRGMSRSVYAIIKGFTELGSKNSLSNIKGVIFNRLAPSLYVEAADYCRRLGVRPLGIFPQTGEAEIESRHLGLVTADEIKDIKYKLKLLAQAAEKNLDIDGIVELASEAGRLTDVKGRKSFFDVMPYGKARIAVARDRAFCFYYEDNLDLLREIGCEIVEFSPMTDTRLPEGTDGLILGGGYPELYADVLEKNTSMREDIRKHIAAGLPTFAECGGFIYLHDALVTGEKTSYNMVGAVKGKCTFTGRLQHFGYVTMTALKSNLFFEEGETVRGHEFHRCVSDADEDAFDTVKREKHWKSYVCTDNLLAGFVHIHFYANRHAAYRFADQCRRYREIKAQIKVEKN